MVRIYGAKEISVLRDFVDERSIRRMDQSRNIFILLGDKKYFIRFHWLDGKEVSVYSDMENFILLTDCEDVIKAANSIDIKDDGVLQFHEFFLELTASDVYKLESLENMITSLEDNLLMHSTPDKDGITDIIKVRKDLLKVKRYYEQMEFLTDELSAVEPSFDFIDKKFDRLLNFTLHLQEYIEQVREAYQSQIDIEQNNLMKIFTVVTSIFLPLTLIAGWYGMNLQMPEFKWAYGYPMVIGVSSAVIVILLIFFKKKKWF